MYDTPQEVAEAFLASLTETIEGVDAEDGHSPGLRTKREVGREPGEGWLTCQGLCMPEAESLMVPRGTPEEEDRPGPLGLHEYLPGAGRVREHRGQQLHGGQTVSHELDREGRAVFPPFEMRGPCLDLTALSRLVPGSQVLRSHCPAASPLNRSPWAPLWPSLPPQEC